ncbi:Diguanylate cyclase [Frankia sp. AiPs1]|uniref:GGDEF domain-containing protein n=1 Tax=Frankia sp. AiPa1 TaxID=573492 RepID=UPI00202B1C63|nr:GGDEF domain-containing protein [Frankia sp. AiPa1]MCL9759699.1 GGDEF domain-containing protein [Frankia sp. AiPa1]
MYRLPRVGDAAAAPRRAAGEGWTPRLLPCAIAGSVLLLGVGVGLLLWLPGRSGVLGTDAVSSAAAGLCATACFWTAGRVRPEERRWRLLLGVTTSGTMIAGVIFALTLPPDASATSSLSSHSLGFFLLYGTALAGLLSLPTLPVRGREGGAGKLAAFRWPAIVVLDCVLIVGSITLLEWGTLLGTLARSGTSDSARLVFALLHSIAGLVLAVAVALIASFRQPRSPLTLVFLGTGLLGYGVVNNVFVYHIALGHIGLPPSHLVGFATTFLLMFLAALVPVGASAWHDSPAPPDPRTMMIHAALPYLLLGAAGLLVVGKLLRGEPLDRFEAYGMVGLLSVALVRQMVTLRENAQLLTDVRERERQLHYLAFHDPLTGLANRALFTRRLQRALRRDVRAADGSGRVAPVSVLFLDLDEFKQVNDTFGHAVGDELLKISAERLQAETRAVDTVARLGGDEFAVLLDGGGSERPGQVGERLAAAVRRPCLLDGRPYTPRASLGLVTVDQNALPASPDLLLHQADVAMYVAKRERAGRLVVYHPDLAHPIVRAPTPQRPEDHTLGTDDSRYR